MATQGNTFASGNMNFSHAKRVWLEVLEVYNGGGVINNASDFVKDGVGVVPAGTPVKLEDGKITAYTDAKIQACADAAAVVALGINGYLQNDVHYRATGEIGTGTVVFHGKMDANMIASATLAKLKLNTTTPMVVFVG